ncbi:anti-sigma factor family protein [Cellulomonas xylanilytica]|uniref:Anti-sigma factor n=1 Tax=Cellulomonas xylanilytica TaxID=233583 RepID=A0A510VBN5_9CELL|nr:zf-HC2 domain-containing protein [Cellulomonas xylanilytica]GEK23411.1 anti-sigma factor [Cellulomonas xylanilytica]
MTGRDTDDQRTTGEDPFREWDAAYVLGSLDPADRRVFEDHLRTCAACRAAVADLAGMPGLLRMVPAAEATTLGGPPAAEVVELAVVARAVQRDRRRRTAVLTGAAAALLVLGGVAGVLLGRPTGVPQATATTTSSQVSALQLEPVGAAAVTADLTLQEKRWGTRIDWECSYPSDDGAYPTVPTYELVLVDDDGTSTVVATWTGGSTGARGLGASSSIVTDTIRRVEIRVQGTDAVLAAAQT